MSRCLALDLGANLGYALFDGAKLIDYGVIRLPSAPSKKDGTILARRFKIINGLIIKYADRIDEVAYECTDWFLPANKGENFVGRLIREKKNRVVQRALVKIEALIEAACVVNNKIAVAVTVHEAKKNVTGKGNAGKDAVTKAVMDIFVSIGSSLQQDAIDAISVGLVLVARDDPLWRMTISGGNMVVDEL